MKMLRSSRARGLTLLELLIAMTIFSVLGIFLFTLVARSLEIYRSAEGEGELIDDLDTGLSPLIDDLSCVSIGDPSGSGQKVEFRCTHDRRYIPSTEAGANAGKDRPIAYSVGDCRSFVLRFVRTFPGSELESTIGRFAGTSNDAKNYIDGVDDLEESGAIKATRRGVVTRSAEKGGAQQPPTPGLLAPGGLTEVMYFVESGPFDPPGLSTLYRCARSPVGGSGSFFDPGMLDQMTPEWIAARGVPIVSHVAYFAVLFWSQASESWMTAETLDGRGIGVRDGSWRGSEYFWDSTRGRLSEFSLSRGAGSLQNYRDDIFPSRAMIVMTLASGGSADGGLVVGKIPQDAKTIGVTNPKAVKAAAENGGYVKIGDEWVRVRSVDGNQMTVDRGVRQTTPSVHEPGTPYFAGRTFTKVVEIPAHRVYFRGPGESQ